MKQPQRHDAFTASRTPLWPSFTDVLSSRGHVFFSLLFALLAGLGLCLSIWQLGVAMIGATDLYLALLLWCATIQSAHRTETWPGLPMRQSAVVMMPLLFIALVLGFAAIYRNHTPDIHSVLGAAYFSLINFGSFTYDGVPANTHALRVATAAQLLSGILLLICAIPLLVSRLTELDTLDKTSAPIETTVRLTLANGEDVVITGAALKAGDHGQELHVSLVAVPKVEVVNPEGAPSNKAEGT